MGEGEATTAYAHQPRPFAVAVHRLQSRRRTLWARTGKGSVRDEELMRRATELARAARTAIDARALPVEIEIDGGIKVDNSHLAADAGVDILVSGTGIFGADDPAAAAREMRASGARR